MGIFGLEPRVLPWQWHIRCHSVSSVMYISGAKFDYYRSNISGDILDCVFYCFSTPTPLGEQGWRSGESTRLPPMCSVVT